MTQLPNSPVGRPAPTKGQPNVYTVLSFLAILMLASAMGFVLYRSSVLFGSMGALFDLHGTKAPPRLTQPVTPSESPVQADPFDEGGDEE